MMDAAQTGSQRSKDEREGARKLKLGPKSIDTKLDAFFFLNNT